MNYEWYGIEGVVFVMRGEYSDPHIKYKGYEINSLPTEEYFYERYQQEGVQISFEDYMKKEGQEVKNFLEEYMRQDLRNFISCLNLDDWDLGGVEISDEDISNILELIEEGVQKEEAIEITLSTIADTLN